MNYFCGDIDYKLSVQLRLVYSSISYIIIKYGGGVFLDRYGYFIVLFNRVHEYNFITL